jgi:hypothetical protein
MAAAAHVSIPTWLSLIAMWLFPVAAFSWAAGALFSTHLEHTRAVLRGAATIGATVLLAIPALAVYAVAYLLAGGPE